MFDFMKHKHKPKPRPHPVPPCDSIQTIDSWRRFVLAELDCYYERIVKSLGVADRETLERVHEIVSEFDATKERVDSALDLMKQEIRTLEQIISNPVTIGYQIKPVLSASGDLVFKVVIENGNG